MMHFKVDALAVNIKILNILNYRINQKNIENYYFKHKEILNEVLNYY